MNKNKELYNKIDLSDRETVKNLLNYRAYFKNSQYSSNGSNFNRIETYQSVYSDLIDIYTDLDILIDECCFTNKSKRLLRMVVSGYDIHYIYTNFENYNQEATIKMFNRIAEKITEKQIEKEGKEDDYKTPERRRKNPE